MSILNLGYIEIEATNIANWKTFGVEKLGLMLGSCTEDRIEFRIDGRKQRITVRNGPGNDLSVLGFELENEDSLNQFVEKLQEYKPVEVTKENDDAAANRGVKTVYSCVGPNDVQYEFYYGAVEDVSVPYSSPLIQSGFVTGEQGVGHVVLYTENKERDLDFFVKGLGFNISDYINWSPKPGLNVELIFLHCNARHHTVALVCMPSEKKMHHFMLEAGQMDDVGRVYDRLQADILMTLGRHSNDQMISFYATTPSGFAVEFGHGARLIDQHWTVSQYDRTSVWGHKLISPSEN